MKRTPNHFSCRKGKRVFIKLTNGKAFIDKFVEKRSKHMVLEDYGKLLFSNIEVFTINKQ